MDIAERLRAALGKGGVLGPEEASRYAVDGVLPAAAAVPASVEEAAEVVRFAAAERLALIPWGGGTKQHLGNRPLAADIVLLTGKLDRIVEHEPGDLTATVEAGRRLASFQDRLAASRQLLALESPWGPGATLGGIVACAASGARRSGWGTPRDQVIGIRVVGGDGKATKAGGRVVKNVTGYDLCKLYTGSLGTLAVIVELSFRLRPLPPGQEVLAFSAADPGPAAAACRTIAKGPFTPAALILLGPFAAAKVSEIAGLPPPAGPWTVLVGTEGVPASLARQAHEVESAARAAGTSAVRRVAEAPAVYDALNRLLPAIRDERPGSAIVKAAVLPSRAPALLEAASAGDPEGAAWALVQPAAGLLFLPAGPDRVEERVRTLGEDAAAQGGRAWLEYLPPALKGRIAFWGADRPEFFLMEGLKDAFDPSRILNPGRFVGAREKS